MRFIKVKHLAMFFNLLSAVPSNFVQKTGQDLICSTPMIVRDPRTGYLFFQYAMRGQFSFAEESREAGVTTFGLTSEARRTLNRGDVKVVLPLRWDRWDSRYFTDYFRDMKIEFSPKGITLKLFRKLDHSILRFTYDPKFGVFLSDEEIEYREKSKCEQFFMIRPYSCERLCMHQFKFELHRQSNQSERKELNEHYLALLGEFGYKLFSLELCAKEPVLKSDTFTLPKPLMEIVGRFVGIKPKSANPATSSTTSPSTTIVEA